MKIVLDTNVFVSSFFGGLPREVIRLWQTGQITLCLSQAILDEYIEVLQRLGLERDEELHDLLLLFARRHHILFTSQTPALDVVRDPDDNKFLECAMALNAPSVVSGDKDLRDLKKYMGIEIMSPREFLKRFREGE